MNVAAVKPRDIANGPGVRVSLFVSGCRHRCAGCFNREAWDFSFGEPFTAATQAQLLTAASPSYVQGLSLLGGEPFEPENRAELAAFLEVFRQTHPDKSIWCYSGFTFEELLALAAADPTVMMLLSRLDVLVDGRFEADKKDVSLLFRGSANQRILNVPASLESGCAVWADGVWQRTMGSGNIEEG